MARAQWKGQLRLKLVSCGVELYPAISDWKRKTGLNLANVETGNRVRYQSVDSQTGEEVSTENVGRSYEIDKTSRVLIDPEELESLKTEMKSSIKLESFIPMSELDKRFISKPYYVSPDSDDSAETFVVLREAMREKGVAGIGKVFFKSKQHPVAFEAYGDGMMAYLLRYQQEVRSTAEYFNVPKFDIDPELIELAEELIDAETGEFDPSQFKDEYGEALLALINKKAKTEVVRSTSERGVSTNIVNLMDALKKSVGQAERRPRRAAASTKRAPVKRASVRRKAG
jgi:DNA end-binding protein Ku